MFTVTNSGTQRIAAIEGNLSFIREERVRIRALLLAAARAGKLSDEGARLANFSRVAARHRRWPSWMRATSRTMRLRRRPQLELYDLVALGAVLTQLIASVSDQWAGQTAT